MGLCEIIERDKVTICTERNRNLKGFGRITTTSTLTIFALLALGLISLIGMATGMYQVNTTQLPRFLFDGDNRLDFLQGFPDVAAYFGFTELIDREAPMARPDDGGDGDA